MQYYNFSILLKTFFFITYTYSKYYLICIYVHTNIYYLGMNRYTVSEGNYLYVFGRLILICINKVAFISLYNHIFICINFRLYILNY